MGSIQNRVGAHNGEESEKKERRFGTVKQRTNTAVIYYCNLALGVVWSFLAPALIDFVQAFRTTMPTMSLVISLSKGITIVSCLAFGYIFGKINRHALITGLFFLMTVMLFMIPYAGGLPFFGILFTVLSVGGAGYSNAQAVWILDLWKDGAGPWIQGEHFFYALGCIIPPTLFAPFLELESPYPDGTDITRFANSSYYYGDPHPEDVDPMARVRTPTLICAGIVGIGGFLLLGTLLGFNYSPRQRRRSQRRRAEAQRSGAETDQIVRKSDKYATGLHRALLIFYTTLFIAAFTSMEHTANQFLPAYALLSGFQMSEADGARVLAAFNIAFTAARLAGVVVIIKLGPKVILVANIVLVTAASSLLLVSSSSGKVEFIWISSVLLGIGFSTSIPTIFSYVRNYIEITNMVGSIMFVGALAMAAFYPLIVGAYIVDYADVIPCLNLVTVALGAVGLVAIVYMVSGELN